MKPQNSAELLRNLVKSAVVDRGQRRALMRAMGLKSQGTITQWLDYEEHNPAVDKLDSIAKFLGCSVSDLFTPISESISGNPTIVQDQKTRSGVESASPLSQGTSHGAEISFLKQQLSDLQAEYDQFAKEVGGAVQYFGSLVGKKAAKAKERESLARQNDRGHDRQLPRERKRRGRS